MLKNTLKRSTLKMHGKRDENGFDRLSTLQKNWIKMKLSIASVSYFVVN